MSYRIPKFKVQLVRDGSQAAETKRISCPTEIAPIITQYLDGVDREHFVIVLLDTKNKVIGISTVSVGTLSESIVHPREVFKPAILANAAGVILAHNHPSGDPTPSRDDITVTKRLAEAGSILGIKVLDHIVIGDNTYFSFKETGFIDD